MFDQRVVDGVNSIPPNCSRRFRWHALWSGAVVISLASFTTGCHSVQHRHSSLSGSPPVAGAEFRHGHPIPVIDGLGWVIGIPNKLALWDRRADNHAVTPATEEALARYMGANGLNDVLVRVNQYDPWGEWKRLHANKRIHPGWRYTVGVYNGLQYTLLPGRVMGGDWYNPFTHTLNIYSDLPPLVMSRVAYAKDVRSRVHPGLYATTQELPIVGMVHQAIANEDVLSYSSQYATPQEQSEAHRILYPDYGGSWGAQLGAFLPFGSGIGRLIGAAAGHAANGARRFQGTHTLNPSACDLPVASDDASSYPTE